MKKITIYMPDKALNLCEGEGNVTSITLDNKPDSNRSISHYGVIFPNPVIIVMFENGQKNTFSGFPFLLVETKS